MRAAVYHGIGEVESQERPDPEPGPGEVLLKVGAAGICGTDLRIYEQGHARIPEGTTRILGHEVAGEIAAVGDGVSGLKPGMRVAVAPNVGCGTCDQCVAGWTNLCERSEAFGITLDGGFAEYMRITAPAVQQGNIVAVPDHVPLTHAALAEPLSCCLNGQEAVNLGPDDVVLVIGDGPIGAMHVLLACLSGARLVVVSGHSEQRLEKIKALGADRVFDPRQQDLEAVVMEVSEGQGADVILESAGDPAAQSRALELAARRGRINFFAGLAGSPLVELDTNLIHYRQLVVTGTTGSNLRQYRAALNLIAAGRVDLSSLVAGRFPLTDIESGIERAQAGEDMRLLIEPTE
ncbi:MAG: zinc-dependent dehydrogenase [Anaerolineales bacterium]|nr:zinc-dependent dehydrogenase [Anaerolineales bacterium]